MSATGEMPAVASIVTGSEVAPRFHFFTGLQIPRLMKHHAQDPSWARLLPSRWRSRSGPSWIDPAGSAKFLQTQEMLPCHESLSLFFFPSPL